MKDKQGQIALFEGELHKLSLKSFDLPRLQKGELLVRNTFSTICGSDLHTLCGKRKEPTPLILGHEVLGLVERISSDEEVFDERGHRVQKGDRLIWSVVWSCGECERCQTGTSQKCTSLFKYGHERFDDSSCLYGGFSEYSLLKRGTALFKVPDSLSDKITAPANCAMATAVSCVREVSSAQGKRVLVQGGGLLGLMVTALVSKENPKELVLVDAQEDRLSFAKRFGADEAYSVRNDQSEENSFDLIFECSGSPEAMKLGMKKLAIRGEYLLAGAVFPLEEKCLDPETIIRKMLTLKGVHNYAPHHLGEAIDFLEKTQKEFPYDEIVGEVYPLASLSDAISSAASGKFLRVGIVNHASFGSES